MPRPKRAKIASNAPSRVASFTQMSQTTTNAIAEPKTRRNASRGQKSRPVSVQEQVEESQPTTKRRRIAMDEPNATAGEASALDRLKRRRSGGSQVRDSLEPRGEADGLRLVSAPDQGREESTPSPENPRRQKKPITRNEDMSEAVIRQSTPQATRSQTTNDLYGLSPQGEKSQIELQKRIQDERRSQTHPRVPSSALKAQPTPIQEASILAFKNFKRRARQPSILRTGRLSMQSTTQLNLDSDLDDFNPDDESTPLHLNKYLTDDDEDIAEAAQSSNSRKRKLNDLAADVHMPGSSPPPDAPIDDAIELMKDTIDLTQDHSSSSVADEPDLPEYIPETAHNTQEQQEKDWSDTMAPPKSSSSLEDEEAPSKKPVQAVKGRKSKTGKMRGSSRELATEKVSRSTRSTNSKPKRPPALSTADLQNLLPQRRNRRERRAKADAFEIPSDSEEDSEDEATSEIEPARPRQRARAGNASGRGKTQPASTARPTAESTKSKNAAKPPLAVSRNSAKKPVAKSGNKKTYGRQSDEFNKENETSVFDIDENNSVEDEELFGAKGKDRTDGKSVTKQSAEMKAMRDKFAEVDDWEMEFESVEAGGEGSSWR